MPTSTDWKQVWLIVAAGIIGACQIGKAAIAVPLLQDDLGLSLVAVSWIVGAYAVMGAVGGIAAGVVVARFPAQRVIVVSLVLIGAGNLLGALAGSAATLFASRVIEGIGFLGLVISAPTLLRGASARKDQDVVFGCWASYIPTGSAIMLLAGPWLMTLGWQELWIVNGALALGHALLLWIVLPARAMETSPRVRSALKSAVQMLKLPAPRLLAAAFMLYTLQYFALTTLLPVLLVERLGLTLEAAGILSGFAVIANAVGNIAAGFIMRWGAPVWALIAAVFTTVAVSGAGVFWPMSPLVLVIGMAAAGLGVTALLPASVLATAPRLSGTASALALMIGLIQQASALGQSFGPVVLAAWVHQFDWSGVPYLFCGIGLIGVAIALRLRSALPRG